jgi:hypothetical protein
MVTLRYEGKDVVVTPIRRGWRIQYEERVVETAYLEQGIGEAVGADAKEAIAFATRLLESYFESLSSMDGSK